MSVKKIICMTILVCLNSALFIGCTGTDRYTDENIPTDSVVISESNGSTGAVEVDDKSEPAETVEPVENRESAEVAESVENRESAEAAESVENRESAEAAESVEVKEPAETIEAAEIPDFTPAHIPEDPVLRSAVNAIIAYKKDNISYKSPKEYVESLTLGQGEILLEEVIANLTYDDFDYYGYYTYNEGDDYFSDCIVETDDGDILGFIRCGSDEYYRLWRINDEWDSDVFKVADYINYYLNWAYESITSSDYRHYGGSFLYHNLNKNCVYAIHGRLFDNAVLQAIFDRQSWYDGIYSPAEFDAGLSDFLSEQELEYVTAELEYEKELKDRKYSHPVDLVNGSRFDANGDGIDERFLISVPEWKACSDFLLEFENNSDSDYIKFDDCYEALGFINTKFMGPLLVVTPCEINCGGDGSFLYSVVGNEAINRGYFHNGCTSRDFYFYDDHMETLLSLSALTTIVTVSEYLLNDDGIFVPQQDYISFTSEEPLIARMDIPVYAEQGGLDIAFSLEEGDSVVILGGDGKDWVKIKREKTQEEGWLNANWRIWLPDGTVLETYDCFWNVVWAG